MNEKIELDISASLLKQLREKTGYTENQAAKKLEIALEDFIKMESGQLPVSIHVIKKLSEIYKYPLITFFEEKAPDYPHQLKDYRINRDKRLTPEVYKAERRAYYLVSELREISDERSRIPEFPNNIEATELAGAFKQKIGLEKPYSKKPEDILGKYKNQLEKKLGIVIIEYPLKAEDVRAFCISSEISIIVLNEQDKPQTKLFSLFHELCHLLLKNSAICSIEIEGTHPNEIEYYCNLFSAETLVPIEDLIPKISKIQINEEKISELTNIYGVSKQVIMLRLLSQNYISKYSYDEFKQKFDVKLLKKTKFGRRNWEKVYLNRVGNLAIKEVSAAYHSGKISTSNAMDILNIKPKYIEKFIEAGG